MLNIIRYSKNRTQHPDRLWRSQIQGMVRNQLRDGGINWENASSRELQERLHRWRRFVKSSLACLDDARHLRPRGQVLSSNDHQGFRVEKIVIEALPGWPIGLSLYLPLMPAPHVPILCPCGHGPKWFDDHQIPPQVYARNGFAAALFDMPWMGERTKHNDHFVQGAQSLLVGRWSNFYFLVDALIVANYLATRRDIDMRRGMGVTGVSGGGLATMFMPHVDRRVKAIAPVCCTVPLGAHIVDGLYTGCLENYMENQAREGFDLHHLLCLAAPIPCLVMGGAKDDMFRKHAIQRAWREIRQAYARQNAAEKTAVFFDNCPHNYTPRMAQEGVKWFRRWLLPEAGKTIDTRVKPLTEKELNCGTAGSTLGMYELTIRQADRLARCRSNEAGAATLRRLLKITAGRSAVSVERVNPPSTWQPDCLSRYIIRGRAPDALPLPVLEITRSTLAPGTILAVGENGTLANLREAGGLGFLRRRMLALDIRGYGELAPEETDYDIYSWCSIDRPLSDLLFMAGATALGQQVEDVMRGIDGALRITRRREEIIVCGTGQAALAALLGGVLHPAVRRIAVHGMPASFRELLASPMPRWNRYHYLPDVLRHFDLPGLMKQWRSKQFFIVDPAGATGAVLAPGRCQALYRDSSNITLAFTAPGRQFPALLAAHLAPPAR